MDSKQTFLLGILRVWPAICNIQDTTLIPSVPSADLTFNPRLDLHSSRIIDGVALEMSAFAKSSTEKGMKSQNGIVEDSGAVHCDPDGDAYQNSGGKYRTCMPTKWNGDLVVHVGGDLTMWPWHKGRTSRVPDHAYGSTKLSSLFTQNGYAFTSSSLTVSGFASAKDAQRQVLELVDMFAKEHPRPNRILLSGWGPFGGHLGLSLMENYPYVFQGGLILNAVDEILPAVTYSMDFLLLFDHFFPEALVRILGGRVKLDSSWETGLEAFSEPKIAHETMMGLLGHLAVSSRFKQFTQAAGFSPTPGQSKDKACKAIFLTLINSLILLTDAQKTGSFRFSNLHTHYAGSFNDTDLNARIVRGEVGQDLPVSFPSMNGQIESPMVSLYLGSIPLFQWQQQRYCEKVQLSARSSLLQQLQQEVDNISEDSDPTQVASIEESVSQALSQLQTMVTSISDEAKEFTPRPWSQPQDHINNMMTNLAVSQMQGYSDGQANGDESEMFDQFAEGFSLGYDSGCRQCRKSL